MKSLYLLIIFAIPASFISGMGLIMFMSSHISNEPNRAVTNQIDNTSISQDNGSAFADVNPKTNRIYIVNEVSNTVTVIDGNDNTKIASIQVGVLPLKLAVNPNTNRIYITEHQMVNNIEQNGTVTVIDGNDNTKIASIQVGIYS